MKVTAVFLNNLEERARSATPGHVEWNTDSPASERWKAMKKENSAYIRAASPDAMLALIQRIRSLETRLNDAVGVIKSRAGYEPVDGSSEPLKCTDFLNALRRHYCAFDGVVKKFSVDLTCNDCDEVGFGENA